MWWNTTIAVVPAMSDDAHRPLGQQHSLEASLSYVENRQVSDGYTIQVDCQTWKIARGGIRAGLRGADVRVEARLDGSMAVRFRGSYLQVSPCEPCPKVTKPRAHGPRKPAAPRKKSRWMESFHLTRPEKTAFPTRGIRSGHRQKSRSVAGQKRPGLGFALYLFKASAQEPHQSKHFRKSKTLGGYRRPGWLQGLPPPFTSEPTPSHRLESSPRARPPGESSTL